MRSLVSVTANWLRESGENPELSRNGIGLKTRQPTWPKPE